MDLPASGPAGSACGGMRLLSAATDSGDSSLAGSGGEVLPRPVCLRGDVPIVSLATQWVGKKNLFNCVGWSPILCGGFTHKYAQFT